MVLLAAVPVVFLIAYAPIRHAAVNGAAAPLPAPASGAQDDFGKIILPLLIDNCFTCHSADLKTAGLNLQVYDSTASVLRDRATWNKVLHKLKAGLMPPDGMPRPDPGQLKNVIAWIERTLGAPDQAASANPGSDATPEAPAGSDAGGRPDPGRVTMRRLNRAEYNNTVRDLLGVTMRPADDFPQDDSGYGFDNIGDVLSLSPVLMEKYMAAAEKIAHTAVFGPAAMKPTMIELRTAHAKQFESPKPLLDYDETGLSLPSAAQASHWFPVDADYGIKAVLSGSRPAGSEAVHVAVWLDGKKAGEFQIESDAKGPPSFGEEDLSGKTQEVRVRIPAGQHWIAGSILRMYEGLPPSYGAPNPSTRRIPPPPDFSKFIKPKPNATAEEIAQLNKRIEELKKRKAPANGLSVGHLEILGPFDEARGPSKTSLERIYSCGHYDGRHQRGCARKIVSNLLYHGFRRPASSGEVDKYVSLIRMAQKNGDSFENGLALAIQAMLVSPDFLFRIETDGDEKDAGGGDRMLGQYELASRLSYFLWSSMPDDELLAAAGRGDLAKPALVEAQVSRMLKDPKAGALAENFGGQWLQVRALESAKPDPFRFPQFDPYLRMSMRRETQMFFNSIVHEDRSILDFIDGNYSYINERLAGFYGIKGVKGPEFRRVDLTGTHRGGVLTQASVLLVSSYATRTSPVIRGKWVLENFLNAPPPPPPPGVPNLNEAAVGTTASMRQQLEEHRKNPTCAACHSRMDPLGFGLENFDAIGRWRTMDGRFPIDASGKLPDGRTFNGPDELKTILKSDRNAFARCVTEKMLTYALGRGVEPYDKAAVDRIVSDLAARDYRFSALVMAIVKSVPFQMRRGDADA